ncbi:MAG: 6-carboxytetrahydropterin synthase, partial [Bacteroidetes bacterium]|nr:6-carboxytetrahydropterin synthase [Bacteroidota bacterium]
VKGEPNTETGFIINAKTLSQEIKKAVTDKVDHRNLNLDVDFMKGKMVSCEVLIREIWNILDPAISKITSHGRLHSLRLIETPRNFVEYFGE